MKESHGEGTDGRSKELGRECREVLGYRSGLEMDEDWPRGMVWTTETTPETVQRLIEWFSNETN